MEETLEEPDWDHDPVDTKLFSPEKEKTISAGLDQSWLGVSFPTTERLTSSSEEEEDRKIKSIYVKVTKDERKTKERKNRKRKEKSKRKESKLSNTHTDRHSEKKNHTTSKKSKCTNIPARKRTSVTFKQTLKLKQTLRLKQILKLKWALKL